MAGHRLKHELDLPLVSTFHTLARVKAETGDPEPRAASEAEAEVIGCSDAILRSYPAEAEPARSSSTAPTRSRIEIVPPGVDHAFFSPGDRRGARRARSASDDDPCCCSSAASSRSRASTWPSGRWPSSTAPTTPCWSSSAARAGPTAHAELARVRQLVDDLGLADRVRFVPPQPHHLLSTYYRAADVCVVPSRSESFGLVALEAAACGTPVVAAAVGGLRTLVDDGCTGFLVEGRDPADFAGADRRAAGRSRPARRRMGRGRGAAARGYTWSTTAARLRRLYADLTARARWSSAA